MLKQFYALAATFFLLVAGLFVAQPAYAYLFINGQVIDAAGQDWTLGGTVYLYGDPGGGPVSCGTATINGSGFYTLAIDCGAGAQPNNFTTMYLVVELTGAGGGTPTTQMFQVTQLPEPPNVYVQNVSSGTGPTAVTLTVNNSSSAMPSIFAYTMSAVALVLAGLSFFAWRRRLA